MAVQVNGGFLNGITVWLAGQGFTSNNSLLIYKGTMPTNGIDWVAADSSSDLLASFGNFTTASSLNRHIFDAFPSPATVNASATGTAAWWAMINNSVVTRYMFGEVSTSAGTGSVHLDSVSLTSGNPVTLENYSIAFVAL